MTKEEATAFLEADVFGHHAMIKSQLDELERRTGVNPYLVNINAAYDGEVAPESDQPA